MNFRKTASQFFQNVADYFEPKPVSFAVVNDEKFDFSSIISKPQGPTPEQEELQRRSYGNFTGRQWTPEEIYQNNVAFLRKNHEEFEKIFEQLKDKKSELTV